MIAMLNCTFYRYDGKRNKINKQLAVITSKSLSPYNDFDVNAPEIIVGYSSALLNCNYVAIDGVYFFVDVPVQCIGNKMKFMLSKDLLMSMKAQILNMDCILLRSTNKYNSYLFDNLQNGQVNFTTFSTPFSGDFLGNSFNYNSGYIYIAAIGGGVAL